MKKTVLLLSFLSCIYFGFSQTVISYSASGSYSMLERSDLRRYDNGSYTGLVSREVRSFVHPISAPSQIPIAWQNDLWFEGNFYIIEKTMRNLKENAIGLENAIPSQFHISSDGELEARIDNGFPTFRSFPSYPTHEVSPGSSWVSEGVRTVDPLNKGVYTKIPMVVQYTYVGEEVYKGEEIFRIKAKWATRYGTSNRDYTGDSQLQSASGSHNADILVLKDTGSAIVIRDLVDESFVYNNGQKIDFKGTITLFTEFPPKVERNLLLPSLEKIATVSGAGESGEIVGSDSSGGTASSGAVSGGSGVVGTGSARPDFSSTLNSETLKNHMLVEETMAGLRLSIRDIRFLPDSDEFLPEESQRLDAIAEVLRLVPNGRFLIEGHTASTGRPEGEQRLSQLRALRTAEELVKRGIGKEQFICSGFGGLRPISNNDTDEGRSRNRRVEITILE